MFFSLSHASFFPVLDLSAHWFQLIHVNRMDSALLPKIGKICVIEIYWKFTRKLSRISSLQVNCKGIIFLLNEEEKYF